VGNRFIAEEDQKVAKFWGIVSVSVPLIFKLLQLYSFARV
jgi:hypothetical protein